MARGLNVTLDDLHLPLLVRAAYGGGGPGSPPADVPSPSSQQSPPPHPPLPKLVVLLRHPMHRLHCAYWHYGHYHTKYGRTAEGFLEYVRAQVGGLKACADRMKGGCCKG
jgi:hypothetical protein